MDVDRGQFPFGKTAYLMIVLMLMMIKRKAMKFEYDFTQRLNRKRARG
jgi:hypothetical protein